LSQPRRSKPIVTPHGALTPESCGTPTRPVRSDDPTQITFWKRMLYQERRSHGKAESIMTKYITSLEREVSDLRSAIFSNITMRPTEKK